jgi:hypothetical protein
MDLGIAGKRALVLGASRGLGGHRDGAGDRGARSFWPPATASGWPVAAAIKTPRAPGGDHRPRR